MNPNRILIDALRVVADKVERDPDSYDWQSPVKCNCGLLARVLLNLDATGLYKAWKSLNYTFYTWTDLVEILSQFEPGSECGATGLDMQQVYQILMASGLEPADFEQIEFLGQTTDKQFLKSDREFLEGWTFYKPEAVIYYFRELAKKLEAQLVSVQSPTDKC